MSAVGIGLRQLARDDQAPHQFTGAARARYGRKQHACGSRARACRRHARRSSESGATVGRGWRRRQHGHVRLLHARGRLLETELGQVGFNPPASCSVMTSQGCCQLRHVVDRDQVDGIPLRNVARTLRFAGHDGNAAVERFGDHAPEGLVPRRAHEQVEGLVEILHVAAEALETHASAGLLLQRPALAAIADDHELRSRQLRLRERLQQHVEALARDEAADAADQEIVVGRTEFRSQLPDALGRQPRMRYQRIRDQVGLAVVGGRHRRQLPFRDAEQRVRTQVVRAVEMQVQRADVACRAFDARDVPRAAPQVRVDDVRPPLLDDLGKP